MTYLVKVYNSKKTKKHFITDIVETDLVHWDDVSKLIIGKKYYSDSNRTKLQGVCRRCEVIREI